ncbi:MAG: DUF1501 domain-containing protein, partial [Verrucomicrobiota bacterium]
MNAAWNILDPAAPAPVQDRQLAINRRQFFGRSATGIGAFALAGLLDRDGLLAAPPAGNNGLPGLPHFPAKAKRIIYLFQNGAPTHIDLFDYKPVLHKLHGTPVPEEYLVGKRFSTMTGNPSGKLMLQPIEPFKQHGKSGAWVSALMPHTAQIVDDLCFIKSMHT